ncbi:MFS transporter [Calidifontimicrobium sp. SYSU G02091]|uniref:MFS transporter n=1 Tax=Calidifontimicrobium sp. SYSU G02091 TaxID=2926421 RepID=UPI001F53346D|nr:MFS transporter [Calidifontimicrobium sp. SYSU G02091]
MAAVSGPVPRAARAPAMPFILVAVLIDMVSVGLIIPVLPALVGTFTGSQADQAFWYGAVAFAFGVASFLSGPVLGGLSDRFGRRPVLLLGFAGLALNFYATALASALWVIVLARLFGGAMQTNIAVAHAYVADITEPAQRARRFGLLGAMFGIGYTLGPVIGGVLGSIDLHLPFWVAGTLALANTLYGAFVLPESLPHDRRQPFDWKRANPVAGFRALAQLRGVGPLVWVIALAGLAQFTMHMSWVLYTTFKFGWGPKENGWSLFAVGVMAAIVQGGLMKRLLERFSPRRLAALGLVSSTLCYLAWGLATEGWMMIAIIVLNLFGFTTVVAIQSLMSNAAGEHEQGRTMGSIASLNSLMGVAAPVIAAALLGAVSHRPPGDVWIGLPFFFCAVLQGMATVVAIRHFQRDRASNAAAPAAP